MHFLRIESFMKKRRTALVSVLILATLIISFVLYKKVGGTPILEKKTDKFSSDVFQVTKPILMDTVYAIDYVADIQSFQHIEVRARVQGFIEKIHVDEGQSVKKGDLLFSVSNYEHKAELLKASAALKSILAEEKAAEVEWENTRELVDKNIISTTQLELAQAKLEALHAKVEEASSHEAAARLYLSYASAVAPSNGVIGRIPNKTGSLVEEGTLLTTISDNSRVYTYFNISEKEYLDFMSSGDNTIERPVSLVLANGVLYPYQGKIESIDNRVSKETGTITLRASFPNPSFLLKHGSSGKVRLRKELKNVLIIPQVATVETQDRISVFTVDDESIVRRRSITIKARLANIFIIESGLGPNDRIVYKGLQLIREGEKVHSDFVNFLGPGPSMLVSQSH